MNLVNGQTYQRERLRWSLETEYRGYRFRSRTEARWAVFFDALGLSWEYEKEGFDFTGLEIGSIVMPKGCRYLPDFWLPHVHSRSSIDPGIWLEVKGSEPTGRESQLAGALATVTGHAVIIAVGRPLDPDDPDPNTHLQELTADGWDAPMVFCRCSRCGYIKVEFDDSNYFVCACGSICDPWDERIASAVQASRVVRFGETR